MANSWTMISNVLNSNKSLIDPIMVLISREIQTEDPNGKMTIDGFAKLLVHGLSNHHLESNVFHSERLAQKLIESIGKARLHSIVDQVTKPIYESAEKYATKHKYAEAVPCYYTCLNLRAPLTHSLAFGTHFPAYLNCLEKLANSLYQFKKYDISSKLFIRYGALISTLFQDDLKTDNICKSATEFCKKDDMSLEAMNTYEQFRNLPDTVPQKQELEYVTHMAQIARLLKINKSISIRFYSEALRMLEQKKLKETDQYKQIEFEYNTAIGAPAMPFVPTTTTSTTSTKEEPIKIDPRLVKMAFKNHTPQYQSKQLRKQIAAAEAAQAAQVLSSLESNSPTLINHSSGNGNGNGNGNFGNLGHFGKLGHLGNLDNVIVNNNHAILLQTQTNTTTTKQEQKANNLNELQSSKHENLIPIQPTQLPQQQPQQSPQQSPQHVNTQQQSPQHVNAPQHPQQQSGSSVTLEVEKFNSEPPTKKQKILEDL